MRAGDFRDDDRGLANGIIVFFAMLIVAGVLFIMLDQGITEVFDTSSSLATQEGARDQQNTANDIWQNIMFVPLFYAVLFLVARAVREGSRP